MNTDKRTDDEINRVIAEWCGWHHIIDDEYGPLRGCKPGEIVVPGFVFTDIPNYCRDLNAVHEAEKKLNREMQFEYSVYIAQVGYRSDAFWRMFQMNSFCATARQRAETLVKVIESNK